MVDTAFCMSGCHPFGLTEERNVLKFSKYPSIDNVDRKKTIDYIMQLGLDQNPWQASLKVHGANFQITTNLEDMKAGKRSGFIAPEDGKFNNWQDVVAMYQQNVIEFYKFLQTNFEFTQLTLYGEIFGGQYDHPDVKADPSATRVQKGVQYCPHNDFFLFDVVLDGRFINKLHVNIAINDFGFIGAKPLFQGSFRECLQLDPRIQDPLHKEFGLPTVEGDNICEGFVIEPEEPQFFHSGSRVILKNKNDEFAEKASHRKQRKIQMPHEWSEEGTREVEELLLYVTENRLRNVLSHAEYGINDKVFGRLMGSLAQDVYGDYMKDREDQYNSLDKKEQGLLKKEMQRACAELIRPNFRNIIDGEF
jgi:Rnl2 family RNA ligase